jgi:hypothetical protein
MRALLLAVSGVAVLGTAEAAIAASCLDEVARLADRYDLKTAQLSTGTRGGGGPEMSGSSTPPTQESRGLGASDTLAPSGGVLAPPPTTDHSMVIEPPRTQGAMPTLPSVPPQAGTGATGSPPAGMGAQAGGQHLSAATRVQAEALLDAARAADAAGKAEECFKRMEEAQALLRGRNR